MSIMFPRHSDSFKIKTLLCCFFTWTSNPCFCDCMSDGLFFLCSVLIIVLWGRAAAVIVQYLSPVILHVFYSCMLQCFHGDAVFYLISCGSVISVPIAEFF